MKKKKHKHDERMDIDELMESLKSDPEMRKEVERRLRRTSYRITISLPTWMEDNLKETSKKLGCSISELIRLALEDSMTGGK